MIKNSKFLIKFEADESFIGMADEIFSISSTLITVISKLGLKTAGLFVLFPSGTNHGLYFDPLLFGRPKQFPEKK